MCNAQEHNLLTKSRCTPGGSKPYRRATGTGESSTDTLESTQSNWLCLGAVNPQSITCVLVHTHGLAGVRQYIMHMCIPS